MALRRERPFPIYGSQSSKRNVKSKDGTHSRLQLSMHFRSADFVKHSVPGTVYSMPSGALARFPRRLTTSVNDLQRFAYRIEELQQEKRHSGPCGQV